MPQRIQQKRTRGWRKPEGAIAVGRGTKWGNEFTVWNDKGDWAAESLFGPPGAQRMVWGFYESRSEASAAAAESYRRLVLSGTGLWAAPSLDEIRVELAGKDLMCWCPLPEPGQPDHCHAAVLLELANPPSEEA